MKSIVDTFVLVAPDCPVVTGVAPPVKDLGPSVAVIQYALLTARPYALTLEDLIFATHVRRTRLSAEDAEARADAIRASLFERPHPCMRASPLPKSYGWGVHYDEMGRLALYAVESPEYHRWASGAEGSVTVVAAMRNKRKD